MYIDRREWIQTVFAATCLSVLGAAATSVEAYLQRAQNLVARHRRNVGRLQAPAERVAEALLAGHALDLGGSDMGWISEGIGRSGGLMVTGHHSPGASAQAGDVQWLSYYPRTYDLQLKKAAGLEEEKLLVLGFGPRAANGVPGFQHWIDSLTPWNADENFALLGNLLSLWTLTGEVAAATARRGKTLVFWQSLFYPTLHPEFQGRNDPFRGHTFHEKGEPQMKPMRPGVVARAYLDSIAGMFHDIQTHELDKIVSVGKEMRGRSASHPATLMIVSHMMHNEVWGEGQWFREYKGDNEHLPAALGSDGYLIYLGYYDGVPPETWDAVRRAKARAAWIVVPLAGQNLNFEQYGDVMINQHYEPGDAAVAAPGYDIRILPPSGIAQLFVYELLMRAAGASPTR